MLTDRRHWTGLLLWIMPALMSLSGCGTIYLSQAARGQWQLMHAREPLNRAIADKSLSPQLRTSLEEVRKAREFASEELGLPDNGSYRSYADVRRPFVVWNVVATPEFSVDPLRWCFPIVGCVAYRGYFSERQARNFALGLRSRGYDAVVEGVPAYSTLGRFADPIVSTMMGYGDTELAGIIFHELAHQLVYVAGDSEFNEAFAVTVEQVGLTRWLQAQGRTKELESWRAEQSRLAQYQALFTRRRAELAHLYGSRITLQKKRERKHATLFELGQDMGELARKQGRGGQPYQAWLREGLNNAHLASLATYSRCVPGFERLLAQRDGDLKAFYGAVRALAGKPRIERHAQLCGEKSTATP